MQVYFCQTTISMITVHIDSALSLVVYSTLRIESTHLLVEIQKYNSHCSGLDINEWLVFQCLRTCKNKSQISQMCFLKKHMYVYRKVLQYLQSKFLLYSQCSSGQSCITKWHQVSWEKIFIPSGLIWYSWKYSDGYYLHPPLYVRTEQCFHHPIHQFKKKRKNRVDELLFKYSPWPDDYSSSENLNLA